MTEYHVRMQIRVPPDMPAEERDRLYEAERQHCQSDTVDSMLVRLWRIPGTTDNMGIWQTGDINRLHEAIAGFPLFPYMTVTITPLARNRNDPALAENRARRTQRAAFFANRPLDAPALSPGHEEDQALAQWLSGQNL